MKKLQQDKAYFHVADGYEERTTDGVLMYRNANMPQGIWKPLPHPVDRLLSHVKILTKVNTFTALYDILDIQTSVVSKIRNGIYKIPSDWLIKIMDYTGLSLEELRLIIGAQPILPRYK